MWTFVLSQRVSGLLPLNRRHFPLSWGHIQPIRMDTKLCGFISQSSRSNPLTTTPVWQHGSCPTCRHPFLDIKPYTESDAESSDGDYIPEDDEEEEDDFFGVDEFEHDIEVEEMEVDLDDIWGYDDSNEDDESDGEAEHPEPDIVFLEGSQGVSLDLSMEIHSG
jgi:hypothetical protein